MTDTETRPADPRVPAGSPMITDPKKNPGWPGPAPDLDQGLIKDGPAADIVVVGGGHAGTQCALAAAEGGAEVLVLESQPDPRHLRWLGEQIGAFNSQFAIGQGLGPYDLMEIIQEFCRCGSYRVSQRLIALYVKNSGEMLDHSLALAPPDSTLLDPDNCNFHRAYGNPAYPLVVGGQKTWAATLQFRGKLITEKGLPASTNQNSRLSELEQCAADQSMALGARWFGGERAVCLFKEDGRVAGVVTKSRDGRYTRWRARRAVCVTTGSRSDIGHKLCVWAGGHMEDNIRDSGWPPEAARSFGLTGFLLLNCRGERFCDESNPYNSAAQLLRQPKGRYCVVFDAQWLKYLQNSGLHHGMADFGMPAYIEQIKEDMSRVLEHGRDGYGVRSCSASEREEHPVWGANTLEELAGILGYEGPARAAFLAGIARYNEMCRKGRDDDFGKDPKLLIPIDRPPYYAGMAYNSKAKQGDSMCPAGVMTDAGMNVLDENDAPIPGLFVAGNTLGDRYCLYYPTPCGGNMIGMAMTHGRCLGKILTGQPVAR